MTESAHMAEMALVTPLNMLSTLLMIQASAGWPSATITPSSLPHVESKALASCEPLSTSSDPLTPDDFNYLYEAQIHHL